MRVNAIGLAASETGWIFKSVFGLIELGSEEESGKDWSDLEREAAEEDNNFNKEDFSSKNKKSDRGDREKHKSSKHRWDENKVTFYMHSK